MKVYLGSDHRGYKDKESIKSGLIDEGYEVVDVGAHELNPDDDYTDYASDVSLKVSSNPGSIGILLCGSGHGVDIVSNRRRGIRSIVGFNREVVVQGREHENANVLSLPSDWISEEEALEYAKLFLSTEFSNEKRHIRRIEKIEELGSA